MSQCYIRMESNNVGGSMDIAEALLQLLTAEVGTHMWLMDKDKIFDEDMYYLWDELLKSISIVFIWNGKQKIVNDSIL